MLAYVAPPALLIGNIEAFLAVAAVIGLRHPSAWAFPLLTKVHVMAVDTGYTQGGSPGGGSGQGGQGRPTVNTLTIAGGRPLEPLPAALAEHLAADGRETNTPAAGR